MQTQEQTNFTIIVTLKTFHGTFGATSEQHEFSFCAESRDQALVLASSNVRSKGFPHDQKYVEVVEAIPAGNPIPSDECYFGDHDLCHFKWCECVCHPGIDFPLESAPLMSCADVQSMNEEEMEAV